MTSTSHQARPVDARADVPARGGPDLSRRSLLASVGLAGVTVVVAGTGVLSYRVFDNGVLDAGSGSAYEAWEHWDTDPRPLGAVAAAILAANPHNTQPWVFEVGADSIDVRSDVTRLMPAVDPLRREHHVGLGCAVENLVLGLAARGFRPEVRLLPDPTAPTHLAHVRFARGPKVSSPLYDAIGSRHSNRGPYRAAPMPAGTLEALGGLGGDLPDVAVQWVTTGPQKAALGSLLVDATRAFIADERQSRDAFGWFRNSRDDINAHRDGPTLDAQGLDDVTLTLAKVLPASSRRGGDDFWLTQTRTVHTGTAAAYGVLTVADAEDIRARLAGGRLLQRIHLAATTRHLGLQHMNQITEEIDRERTTGVPPTFGPRFREILASPGRVPLVTFRLGLPQRAARLSPRRSLAAVTT